VSFGFAALNAISLGGHGELVAARVEYQAAYQDYRANHVILTAVVAETNQKVAHFGKEMIAAFSAVKKTQAMLRPVQAMDVRSVFSDRPWAALATNAENPKLERLMDGYSAVVPALGGTGAGTALAVGSWSLVAMAGTASTGTAISTISGIAATNATLAWFGGGALAAGGAGMAGGTWVLAAIVIVPTVLICAWYAYSKAQKFRDEIERVKQENIRIMGNMADAHARLSAIDIQTQAAFPAAKILRQQQREVRAALFPVPLWFSACRRIKSWLGKPYYSDEEMAMVWRLEQAASRFVAVFTGDETSRTEQ
jgi:hypothetical protein